MYLNTFIDKSTNEESILLNIDNNCIDEDNLITYMEFSNLNPFKLNNEYKENSSIFEISDSPLYKDKEINDSNKNNNDKIPNIFINKNNNKNEIKRKKKPRFKIKVVPSKNKVIKVILKLKNNNVNEKRNKYNRHDLLKRKVFNKCFEKIESVIRYVGKTLYPKLKFHKIKKSLSSSSNNEKMKAFCKKNMKIFIYEECSLSMKLRKHNKKVIENILSKETTDEENKKLKLLLERILNMTFGEILGKFLDDINFVKELYSVKNIFSVFSDNFQDFPEFRKNAIISDFKINILNNNI